MVLELTLANILEQCLGLNFFTHHSEKGSSKSCGGSTCIQGIGSREGDDEVKRTGFGTIVDLNLLDTALDGNNLTDLGIILNTKEGGVIENNTSNGS